MVQKNESLDRNLSELNPAHTLRHCIILLLLLFILYFAENLSFCKGFVSHVANVFNADDRMSVTGKLSFFTGELT